MTSTPIPELVRGNVKAAMKEAGASSADLWNVAPSMLRVLPGLNGRIMTPEYKAHIESTAQSIIENGYYQDKPIAGFVANEDGVNVIYVTEGHTRHAAVQIAIEKGAPIETVPVVIKPKGTTMEDLTIALVTSNNGRPFTPYETGMIIKRLIDMGLTEKVVAQRLGYGLAYTNDLLTLVGAPKAVRDMLVAGQVSATEAIKTLKQHGSKAASQLKSGLAAAKKDGKTKVTAKHLGEKKVPKAKGSEIDVLKARIAALEAIVAEVHSWIVCMPIATPEDMMQNADRIVEITAPGYDAKGEAL